MGRTPEARDGDTTLEWPAIRPGTREREGAQREELTVVHEDEDGRMPVLLAPEEWRALDKGEPVRWRQGSLTGTEVLDP